MPQHQPRKVDFKAQIKAMEPELAPAISVNEGRPRFFPAAALLSLNDLAFVSLLSLLPQVSSSMRGPPCTASLNGGKPSTSSGKC